MPFVWRDTPENADLLWLTRGFAEAASADQWEEAWQWASVALEVSQGGYALVPRDDRCAAVTRQARHCPNQPPPGQGLCGLHARLINLHKQDKADA
jgi:hypothetical protein